MASMTASLLLRNVRLLLPQDGLAAGARAALVMVQGRIRALVPDTDARRAAPAGIAECDGGGGWLLPGIVDAHFHLLGYASSLVSVDCGPERVRSIAEIQARVREA